MLSTDPDRPVMTVREAATTLNVNVKTLYAAIACGDFPAIRLGRTIRVSRAVVAPCLEQGRVALSGGIHAGMTRS